MKITRTILLLIMLLLAGCLAPSGTSLWVDGLNLPPGSTQLGMITMGDTQKVEFDSDRDWPAVRQQFESQLSALGYSAPEQIMPGILEFRKEGAEFSVLLQNHAEVESGIDYVGKYGLVVSRKQ